jgi:hypothetical protein
MISVVRDSDSMPLTLDDSMLSPLKLYTISNPPIIALTGNSGGLQTNIRIGTIRLTNFDTSTGMTIS